MSIYENTVFKPGEIGIIHELPMAAYRSAPGVAESDLQTLLRSPAEFHRGERKDPTEDMQFGTLFHSLLFSGNADFHTAPEYYPAPESSKKDAPTINKEWNWNANHCKAWRESHQDKPIIPRHGPNSAAWLKAMALKVEAHPVAKDFISRLSPEVSVFSRNSDYPTLVKGRLDGLIRGETTIVVELKTTRDASTAAFSREILKRGYYRKAAWYRMLLHEMRISPMEFWFVAVEKGDHPRVNVRQLAERAMDKGDLDNDDAMTLLQRCRMANFWPELPDATFPGESQGVPFIDLPDYAYGASVEELAGMTEIETEPEKTE